MLSEHEHLFNCSTLSLNFVSSTQINLLDTKGFGTHIRYPGGGISSLLSPLECEILVKTRGILECFRKHKVDEIVFVSSPW